jgi:hypothetical protein
MAQAAKRSNFWVSVFALILYTLACGAIPVYHQMTDRSLKPALNINLDSIYLFIFLLGTAIIGVVFALHRRIEALETRGAATKDRTILGPPSADERV